MIRCIDISSDFHIIACGTDDNMIVLISLTTKTISRIIETKNSSATKILITKAWGFIVAFTGEYDDTNAKMIYKIIVMTCNGDIVKTDVIKHQPLLITSFTDSHGFDHIIYLDESGLLFQFEVYYPENKQILAKGKSNICAIQVIKENNICLLVSNDGKLSFCNI